MAVTRLPQRLRIRARRATLLAVAAALAAGAVAFAAGLAPGFRLPGLAGGELTNADLSRGKTLIVVWASWSPRCRDIVERTNALDARWKGEARVVTVDFQEDAATVRAFLKGKGLAAPVYLDGDGEFSKALAVTSLPGLVVVRDGDVRYQGRLPADADAAIAEALR
jgi:thiol-disulfide isomerase/thioredoxin